MTFIQVNGSTSVPEILTGSAAFTTSDSVVVDLVTTRQGYWDITGYGAYSESASGGPLTYRLNVGGSVVDSQTADSGGSSSGSARVGLTYGAVLAAGVHMQITGMKGNAGDSLTMTLRCVFVPTPDYKR
jgi:hypothetical protein